MQQVGRTDTRKNSSQFHISTAPYDDLKGCTGYILRLLLMMKQKQRLLTLNEQKYLVELYEANHREWSGTGPEMGYLAIMR